MEKPYHHRCWNSEKNLQCEIILKKLIAIFLLSLMLFNMAGYRVVFAFMENKSTNNIQAAIDTGNFTDDNLVEVKIPLNMPYYSDKGYEAAYGETIINGRHYNYVKRKVEGNTLYLLCLPNTEKTKLLVARSTIEKNCSNADNDNPRQNNQHASVIKLLQAEFLVINIQLQSNNSIVLIQSTPAIQNSRAYNLFSPLTPAQPPELRS